MEDMTIRMNIRVSQKVKDYLGKRSAETGASMSALITLCMEEYIDQKEALNSTPKLMGGVADIKELLTILAKEELNIDMALEKEGKPCEPNV